MAAGEHFSTTIARRLPVIMIVAGIIGLLASFMLTYDKIQVLQNPAHDPLCNINPILSCGSVMKTEQASLLGVPNTIFGIMAFTALTTLGFVLLTRPKLPRWMWQLAQVFATGGAAFMLYLFFQGVYRIQAICPWCFVVWMITIPVFWYVTIYNLQHDIFGKLTGRVKKAADFAARNHGNILIVFYLIIFGILLEHFWYYWKTLL